MSAVSAAGHASSTVAYSVPGTGCRREDTLDDLVLQPRVVTRGCGYERSLEDTTLVTGDDEGPCGEERDDATYGRAFPDGALLRIWRARMSCIPCVSQPAYGATLACCMDGMTMEDRCVAVAGPWPRTCRAELHNELGSQTTARAILDSPSPPLAQSGGETDEWSTQHHGDRSAELHNGAEDLDDEAESFDTNAEGLEMKDVAGRTTPMDGGTSQMPQRKENHPQDTGCATRGWLRYRLKPRSSAFRERCLGLWRKGAARCHITTSGSNRGDRHLGSRDCTNVMPIITKVRGRSEPDIPHLPGPECLV